MAAVLGSRLATHLAKIVQPRDIILWSDSQIVLYWLATDKPQKRFIRNRISEIREKTAQYNLKYCPTVHNPADLLTRGLTSTQFKDCTLWHSGPGWIVDKTKWPSWNIQYHKDNWTNSTIENQEKSDTKTVLGVNIPAEFELHRVIDINRYSTYQKLLNVTAYVLRFFKNYRNLTENRIKGHTTVMELHMAEMAWIRNCQSTDYSDEILNIKCRQRPLTTVKQLRLFLDPQGHIRCGGRIHNAPLEEDTKFPYLLPRKHTFTKLVIQHIHKNVLHSGFNATVTQIRQKYWIPSIRQVVKSEIKKCVTCLKVAAKPFQSQS